VAEGLDLSASPVLAGLTVADVDEIERVATIMHYDAGRTIFSEGEVTDAAGIVLSGRVSLRTTLGSEQIDVAEAGPGDLIGWSGLVPPHRFSATAVAGEAATVALLKTEDLARLSEEDQYLGRILMRNVASLISERLREAHKNSAALVQQLRSYVPSGKAMSSRAPD